MPISAIYNVTELGAFFLFSSVPSLLAFFLWSLKFFLMACFVLLLKPLSVNFLSYYWCACADSFKNVDQFWLSCLYSWIQICHCWNGWKPLLPISDWVGSGDFPHPKRHPYLFSTLHLSFHEFFILWVITKMSIFLLLSGHFTQPFRMVEICLWGAWSHVRRRLPVYSFWTYFSSCTLPCWSSYSCILLTIPCHSFLRCFLREPKQLLFSAPSIIPMTSHADRHQGLQWGSAFEDQKHKLASLRLPNASG